MSDNASIRVEVAYALPERQALVAIDVGEGTTALEAVQQSGLDGKFPDLTIDDGIKLGIFGQIVTLGHVLKAGDRVEIYRPLKADPKEVRKARAARAAQAREDKKAETAQQVDAASTGS
ncbi:MAG: RnfH family protein [Pseudomonadota bacterium]